MQYGSVLDIHMVANLNPIDITTQDCIEPNGATIADDSITDNSCILCQKAIFAYLRSESSYRNNQSHDYRAAMIAQKSAAFKLAPPIKPPSTSGFAKSSAAFFALQLPP